MHAIGLYADAVWPLDQVLVEIDWKTQVPLGYTPCMPIRDAKEAAVVMTLQLIYIILACSIIASGI